MIWILFEHIKLVKLTQSRFYRSVSQICRPLSTNCVVWHDHAADAVSFEVGKDVGADFVVADADVVGLVGARSGILSECRSIILEAL